MPDCLDFTDVMLQIYTTVLTLRFAPNGIVTPLVIWLVKVSRSFGCTKSMKFLATHISLGYPNVAVIETVVHMTRPSFRDTAAQNPSPPFET